MTRGSALSSGALLLIDKPAGMTSHDVVERARTATGVRRIGHSGTLDPMATGLLLLCAGGAARLQGFFTGLDKSYEGIIRLGLSTDTYDKEGEPLAEPRDASRISLADIEAAAAAFRGEFPQAPPPFSAKKVAGRKLYEMARKGEKVAVAPKMVRVTALEFSPPQGGVLPFRISCSSGTYIRSIAHDLGERLSCGAHLESLRRTSIGSFRVEDAAPLEAFEKMSPEQRLAPPHGLPLSRVPLPFERVKLASLEAWKVRRGQGIPARSVAARQGDWVALIGPSDDLIALGTVVASHKISLIQPRIVLADEAAGR
jgi:tRNA pseudouridine55 synthase